MDILTIVMFLFVCFWAGVLMALGFSGTSLASRLSMLIRPKTTSKPIILPDMYKNMRNCTVNNIRIDDKGIPHKIPAIIMMFSGVRWRVRSLQMRVRTSPVWRTIAMGLAAFSGMFAILADTTLVDHSVMSTVRSYSPGNATLVVAASNALHPNRADYVCSGTNDQITINSAISALPAGGGKIVLSEGTFYFSAKVTVSLSNVIIEGQGISTVLASPAGASALGDDFIYFTGKSNILLRNFKVLGTNQTAGGAINAAGASYNIQIEHVVPSGTFGAPFTSNISLHFESTDFDSSSSTTCGIQEAINALPATGGEVFIPAGTHTCSYYISPRSNVTLYGCGAASIIKLANGRNSTLSAQALLGQANLTVVDGTQFRAGDWICIKDMGGAANSNEFRLVSGVVGNVVTVSVNLAYTHAIATQVWTWHPLILPDATVSNFKLRNVQIDGNKTNQMVGVLGEVFAASATNISILPAYIDPEITGGIVIVDAQSITIENVTVNHMPWHGIFLWGATQNNLHCKILNCIINDCADKGIVSLQYDGTIDSDMRVDGNTVWNTGNGPTGLMNASHTNNFGDCIQFHSPTGNGIFCNNNKIYGPFRRCGIYFGTAGYSEINNNMVYSVNDSVSGNAGIIVDHCNGFSFSGTVVVLNNSNKTCAWDLYDSWDGSVIGGSVSIINDGTGGGAVNAGAFIVEHYVNPRPHDITITGVVIQATNVGTNPTHYSLHLYEADNITFDNCIILNPGGARPAVYIYNSTKTEFNSCKIRDDRGSPTMTYGITTTAGSSGLRITNTDIQGYVTGPINDAAPDTGPRPTQSIQCFLAYGTTNVLAANFNGAFSATAQPDAACGRNLTYTKAGVAAAGGQIIATGLDTFGNAVSETIAFAGGAETKVGVKLFASITAATGLTISALTAGDTISVGLGNKVGLDHKIFTGAVKKCFKSGVGNYALTSVTEDVTYHGVTFTDNIAANDEYQITSLDCLA